MFSVASSQNRMSPQTSICVINIEFIFRLLSILYHHQVELRRLFYTPVELDLLLILINKRVYRCYWSISNAISVNKGVLPTTTGVTERH